MTRRPLDGDPRISCDDECHKARGSLGGTDYAVPVGTPVYAPFAGRFTMKGADSWPTGRYANVHRSNGDVAALLHLDRAVGGTRDVIEGELIAYSGASGRTAAGKRYGPHLHAHVVVDGKVVGMEEYLTSPAGGGQVTLEGEEEMKVRQNHYTRASDGKVVRIMYVPGTAWLVQWTERGAIYANRFARQHETGDSQEITESLAEQITTAAERMVTVPA